MRRALQSLPERPHGEACETVAALEREHGARRNWVWARLDLAPLAGVLEPLAALAAAAQRSLGGAEPSDVADAYAERGWQADLGAWRAVAAAPNADEARVAAAVRHLLQPWLDESARAFQAAVERAPLPGAGGQAAVEAEDDGCLVFVDGLRFDLGQRLAERMEGRGCRVALRRRWAALPAVTGTGKPAVTPAADEIEGELLGPAFGPRFRHSGKPADAPALRAALEARGYQILGDSDDSDAPRAHPARGWLETGEFDTLGHQRGARLARDLDGEIERVAERIERVLEAGWASVRVVTDHGWLWLPGGLPKVDLPQHLTESRWARCAALAGEAAPDVVRAPWHWNGAQWFATPPGAACFNRSEEYAHGGLSIQECLLPDLVVTRAGGTDASRPHHVADVAGPALLRRGGGARRRRDGRPAPGAAHRRVGGRVRQGGRRRGGRQPGAGRRRARGGGAGAGAARRGGPRAGPAAGPRGRGRMSASVGTGRAAARAGPVRAAVRRVGEDA